MITNNLEHLKFGQVSDDTGNSYASFRRTLQPNFKRVWLDIVLLYAIQIFIFSFFYFKIHSLSILNIALTVFLAVCIGFFLASLNLFIHEAAHYNIAKDKKNNDVLANMFIGIWFGMNVKSYRIVHWQHHEKLGTTEDTEHSYFNTIDWKFILSTLFGIHVIKILLFRKKLVDANTETKVKDSLDSIMFFSGILLNLSLLGFAFWIGNYFWIPAWIIGMFSVYPFFNSLRQALEHRDEKAVDYADYSKINHGKLSRFFRLNLFSFFFGGAGFDKHMLHHWDPQISYTRLGDVENFLHRNKECDDIIEKSKTTYFKTFLKLLR